MGTLLLTAAGTALAAAIIGAWRWLTSADNRQAAKQAIHQRICRHQWEPINEPGAPVYFASGYDEWCVKCGARR